MGPDDVAQMFHRLKCAAGNDDAYISPIGITLEEFLGTDAYTGERNLILGQDLEKSKHASWTGADFGGGRALLLDFKGVGTSVATTQAKRCHVLILHESAVSITESGCLVSM